MTSLDGLLNRLNDPQRMAATTSKPRVLVIAGAGSGKTSVLTTRIAHLQLRERVGTSNMLALTFTRLAAMEMKERVGKLLGDSLAKNLTAGTFHSFCVRVLRSYGHKIGIESSFSVYGEEDRQALLDAVIQDLVLKGKVSLSLDPWVQTKNYFEKQVVDEYLYRLCRNNALDLDGLLAETVRLLTDHPDVTEEIRQRLTHWFVDEYQDTDSRQEQIISLVNPENLFVVGDPSQAIYGWRGAEIENILTFEERNPGTQVIRMERNYRSTKPILELANKVIGKSQHKSPLQLWADKEGPEVILNSYQSEHIEAQEIARAIQEQINQGIKPESIAVLCRTNFQVDNYNLALESSGLKTYVISNKADPLKSYDVRRILDFMAYICNPKDGRALRNIVNWPEQRMTELQLHQAELDATSQMVSLAELLEDKLDILDYWASRTWESDVRSMWVRVLQQLRLEERYLSQGLNNRIHDLERAGQAIERWCGKQEVLGDSTDPYSFLRWLRMRDIQERLVQEQPEGVQLLTVHAAKGLEWDHVYVPGCNRDVFPSKKGDPEEERRLFYVAVTRARETLNLSYYNERETNWGKREIVAMSPSPFLDAMEVSQ